MSEACAGTAERADDLVDALRQAVNALERLRRGHGAVVSGLCYPALNVGRDILEQIDEALK